MDRAWASARGTVRNETKLEIRPAFGLLIEAA